MSGNNDSRLVRPDGLPANAEVAIFKLWEIEYPLPTNDPKVMAAACMQDVPVQDPVTGNTVVTRQMAMPAHMALLLMETVKALEVRDTRIENLTERLTELESRFEDPIEHAKMEGYDDVS